MKFTATFYIAALVALVSAQAESEGSVSSSVSEIVSTSVAEVVSTSVTEIMSSSTMTTSMMLSSTVTLPASSVSVSLTPQQSCASQCAPGDVNCTAICYGVPNPNASQVNQTTECAARCPQGSGSAADTEAYAKCQQGCITSIYLSTRTEDSTPTPPAVVGGATSTSATGTTVTTGSTVTHSSSGSASGTSTVTRSTSGSSAASASSSSSSTASASAASSSPSNAAGHMQIGAPLAGLAGIVAALIAL
ncbi:MAG: hypothetical protein M1816_002046 [Peltula sp. TS41687]|nr:MAG: hypothetical protein M1816_002046 [Peltula sp. TS41687]